MIHPGDVLIQPFTGIFYCEGCGEKLGARVEPGEQVPTEAECPDCHTVTQLGDFIEIHDPDLDAEGKYSIDDLMPEGVDG